MKKKSSKVSDIKRIDLKLTLDTDIDTLTGKTRLPEVSDPGIKFNMHRLIKSILKSDLGVPLDVKVNDSHLPTAPNFVTFLNGHEFLNVKAFARQNEIPTKLFQEYCPDCTDLEWFDNVPVDADLKTFKKKVTLLVYGKCPKCGAKRSDLINSGKLKPYQELAGCAGQRGAKSHLVAMIAAYILHRFLKLQNPIQLFGLNAGTILHGTFVALTYAQAKETLWDPFYEYLSESPWFSAYHAMLDSYGEQYGEELYRFKDTFILYRHRKLLMYASGPNKKTLRGRTRFFGAIDEIGWFNNDAQKKKVKDDASEVYIALERSLLTVRASANRLIRNGYDNVLTAYFTNVSSPSHARDKIMDLVKKSKLTNTILAFHRPTWEMNPNITRADLDSEYAKDPVEAERDYGANPPLTNSPFIKNILTVLECCKGYRNATEISYKQRTNKKSRDITRFATPGKIRRAKRPSILALDAGYSNNAFGCCIAHIDKETQLPVIDLLLEIQPLPGVPVNHSLIYSKLLVPLIESRNVKMVCADRWQSIKLLQDIGAEHEIETSQYSVTYEDMGIAKSFMEDQEVTLPLSEWKKDDILEYDHSRYPNCFSKSPIAHFILQCVTVQDTGSKVLKGENLNDDMFRAYCLAMSRLLADENQELFNGPDGVITGGGILGSVSTKTGGSRGTSVGSQSASDGKAMGTIRRRC